MKFRRRVKLFPGVNLNLSKSGISTTIGGRGASVNFNKKGTFLNTGIPGTGLYDRQKIGNRKKKDVNPSAGESVEVEPIEKRGAIKSDEAETLTTEGLQELKEILLECYQERIDLKKEINKVRLKLILATILLVLSRLLIFGFFIEWFKKNRGATKEYLVDLKSQLEICFVDIDMELDPKIEEYFIQLSRDYKQLISSEKIWDITSSVSVDRKSTRSAASHAITKKQVKFGFKNIDIIKSKYNALYFENANGGDLYIYPAFIALVDSKDKFGLIDIRDLKFNFYGQRFLEEGKIPSDSKVVDETWAKVNKNGTRDKRFKDNYRIPICLYGEFSLKSETGLNEAYSISSYEKAEKFARSMEEYQRVI